MTKVTREQVEAHAKATTFTPNCKDIIALYQNGNRKSWEVYGKYDKERKVNCVRGQKCYKTVEFYGWHKVTKMEAADLLAVYGLTIEEFVAIENGNYEIVDDDNNVEEIDAGEYAVSAEAFDSAVDAEIENAKAAVNVDLSNAEGVKTAENQICAALQNNSLSDGDYALVKMAHKMIATLVEEDELAKKCAAIDSVCAEVYAVEAYTSAYFMTITLKDMRELGDAKDLMILAKVNENDYRTSWGKGLIRGFSFNRNAVAKAVIYTLNLAGIKADGRTDYAMVEEVDAENDASNVEIENAVKGENDMPSIEKIFAAVTTEIKPHVRGKYFVQIDDNWYQQSVRESFKTLEDAVKIARIMHSELRKVSRHIYATVEARTVDISKYCFRADDWTTFFEIDNYGNEKVLRRETVDAIAKIENRTVEEVKNDIGGSGDNYRIYKNSAAEVENILDEIDNGNYAIKSIESRIEKITSEFNEVKDTAEQLKAKEIQFLIDCANEEIDFAKKRIADAMKEINGKNIDGAKAEVAGMIERIEYAEETFDRANSVPAAFEEVTAEKNSLKAKVEEILNRPRKSVIDWKATFEDMKISEILNLQKDLKKFLKLGQIDLAENVFSMLKTLCKNYRDVAA